MKTRILVNNVNNRIVSMNISAIFADSIGEVCPKLNNMLAKGKWIIFDNK